MEINHMMPSCLVGDNRIELVPQGTAFEGAKRRANASESRMQEVKYNMKEKERTNKKHHGANHMVLSMFGGR